MMKSIECLKPGDCLHKKAICPKCGSDNPVCFKDGNCLLCNSKVKIICKLPSNFHGMKQSCTSQSNFKKGT